MPGTARSGRLHPHTRTGVLPVPPTSASLQCWDRAALALPTLTHRPFPARPGERQPGHGGVFSDQDSQLQECCTSSSTAPLSAQPQGGMDWKHKAPSTHSTAPLSNTPTEPSACSLQHTEANCSLVPHWSHCCHPGTIIVEGVRQGLHGHLTQGRTRRHPALVPGRCWEPQHGSLDLKRSLIISTQPSDPHEAAPPRPRDGIQTLRQENPDPLRTPHPPIPGAQLSPGVPLPDVCRALFPLSTAPADWHCSSARGWGVKGHG